MYVEPLGEEGEDMHWLKVEGVLQVKVPGVQGSRRAVAVGEEDEVVRERVLVARVVKRAMAVETADAPVVFEVAAERVVQVDEVVMDVVVVIVVEVFV